MQQTDPVWKNKFIVLETERLLIFPLSRSEMRLYTQQGNALEKSLGLEKGNREITPELTDALKHSIMPAIEQGNSLIEFVTLWTIIYRQDNVMVGDLCFKGGPGPKKEIEIGYGTYPEYRGKGFMSEAIIAITRWALSRPDVKLVLAETKDGNVASQQILKKAGFRLYKQERGMFFWKKE